MGLLLYTYSKNVYLKHLYNSLTFVNICKDLTVQRKRKANGYKNSTGRYIKPISQVIPVKFPTFHSQSTSPQTMIPT